MFVVIDFDTQILLHLLKIQKVAKLFLFGGLPMLRTWRKEKSGKSFSLSKGNNSLVLTEEIKNRRKIDIGYIHIFSLFSKFRTILVHILPTRIYKCTSIGRSYEYSSQAESST